VTRRRRCDEAGFKVTPLPLLRIRDSQEWQTVEIERPEDRPRGCSAILIERPGQGFRKRVSLREGSLRVRAEIPCTEPPGAIRLRWGEKPGRSLDVPLSRPRRWRVHLLHHTHVDIGYTDLPSRVCEQQAEILDQVVDLCERTRGLPEPARFRWVNECFWPVANYLRRRTPKETNSLVRWMRRGAIENTALYMNMTELWTEEMIARSLRHAVRFCAEYRLPLAVAAQTDCPGVSWAVPQLLNQIGIRYLAMSTNSIRARPPRLSRPFWWRTPSGQVLVWNTDPDQGHYGEGYRHGFRHGYAQVLERMPRVLARYEDQGYPYSVYSFRLGMDNCYPLTHLSDLARKWNETWVAPQLRISTFREFFRELEPLLDGCDVAEGAWPDWWADGHASAAFHTARARRLWRRLDGVERAHSVLAPDFDISDLADRALENLFLFDEHTWGAQGCARQPFSARTMAHWAEKELPLFLAGDEVETLKHRFSRRFGRAQEPGRLAVMNPSLRARRPIMAVAQLGELEPAEFRGEAQPSPQARLTKRWLVVDANTGTDIPSQMLHPNHTDPQRRGDVALLIPEIGGLDVRRLSARAVEAARVKRRAGRAKVSLKNEHYQIAWTQEQGLISWRDAAHGREWIATGCALAGPVVERAIRRTGKPERHRHFPSCNRSTATSEAGPVFDSLTWTEALEGTGGVMLCLRLYHACPRLELALTINKLQVLAPEALFIAFPFEAARPRFLIHAPGGTYASETEQLPGSARDYHHVEAGLALLDGEDWLALLSPDAPLFHLQQPNTARWLDQLDVRTGHVFSNPMSNYWHTNFRPSQTGSVELTYILTSGRGNPRDAALRSLHEGLADAVVVPGWPKRTSPPVRLLEGTVDLLSLRRDGDSLWIRLKEMMGKPTRCTLEFPGSRAVRVERTDPCGGSAARLATAHGKVEIPLGPYEVGTLRVEVAGAGRRRAGG
jgi:alpha-mannosidase